MRTAFWPLALTLLWSAASRADDDEPCPRPLPAVFEVKVRLAEGECAKPLSALRASVRAVIAVDESDCSALARVDRAQYAKLTARADLRAEPWQPLVETPAAVIDVSTRPRLEPPLATPGWAFDARGARGVYLVKLASPFTAAHNEFIDQVASRLNATPADLEFAEVNFGSPQAALRGFLTRDEAARVSKMPEVRWVGAFEPVLKVSFSFFGRECPFTRADEAARAVRSLTNQQQVAFTVGAMEATPEMRAIIGGHQATLPSLGLSTVTAPGDVLRRLALRPEVEWFEPEATPSLDALAAPSP